MDAPPEPEVLGHDEPRLTDRWTALPDRTRRSVIITAGLLLLAGLTGYGLATRPATPVPTVPTESLMPYPLQSTELHYVEIDGPISGQKVFHVRLTAESSTGAALTHVTQGYDGLHLKAGPPLPIKLPPGQKVKFTVTFEVEQCAGVPLNASMAFLDVTLRNTRAIQVYSAILGDRYATDLSAALRALCEHPKRAASPGT
ncbi:hypothetical protein G5C51_12450 [Streptomyces sp. A7024]|uniref:Tat pathway signal sequence domain protein n=1 Tax=Streptomyces coryli TaxID=1128680 RepID=A0A6G4U004_9ACTN|nr:hypothetical protein [Streptomyces coryli]NGN64708.1 hypothetical protein [Streptomyces coryli]